MIEPLATLAAAGLAALLGLTALRALGSLTESRETFALTFPRTVTPEELTAALRSLAGLLPPWWRRWLSRPSVVFEVAADEHGIAHRVTVPRSRAPYLTGQLRAAIPGLGSPPPNARRSVARCSPASSGWLASASFGPRPPSR